MIVEKLGGGSFLSNCYLVASGEDSDAMVIDPSAKTREILRGARRLGLTISLIVITHAHPDHVSSLTQLKEVTKAEFLVHEDEDTRGVMQQFGKILSMFQGASPRSLPRPDGLLREGDVVRVGELNFSVLHTPGHTSGGICLYGHGILFSGDTLFNSGVGRTDMPGMSHAQLMNGICDKLMVLPDETIVYPGHGLETTIGYERRLNSFVCDWQRQSRS